MPQKSLVDLILVKDFLETVGGMDAINLVKVCENKKKAFTDEEIAKKLKKKVTEVRATLNRLHYRGIATYQKSRNQKTGWYNYTWEIKKDRMAKLIIEKEKENVQKLIQKKNLEADYNHFDCDKCSERMPFEVAAEYNFLCPGCGGTMNTANDPRRQRELEDKIKRIQGEMITLNKIKE